MLGLLLLALVPAVYGNPADETSTSTVAAAPDESAYEPSPVTTAGAVETARKTYPKAWFYSDSHCTGSKHSKGFTFDGSLNSKTELLNQRVALGVQRDPQGGGGVRPEGGCLYLNGKDDEKIKIEIPYYDEPICYHFGSSDPDRYESYIAADKPCTTWEDDGYELTSINIVKYKFDDGE